MQEAQKLFSYSNGKEKPQGEIDTVFVNPQRTQGEQNGMGLYFNLFKFSPMSRIAKNLEGNEGINYQK